LSVTKFNARHSELSFACPPLPAAVVCRGIGRLLVVKGAQSHRDYEFIRLARDDDVLPAFSSMLIRESRISSANGALACGR
jgi:hypothetical protein